MINLSIDTIIILNIGFRAISLRFDHCTLDEVASL